MTSLAFLVCSAVYHFAVHARLLECFSSLIPRYHPWFTFFNLFLIKIFFSRVFLPPFFCRLGVSLLFLLDASMFFFIMLFRVHLAPQRSCCLPKKIFHSFHRCRRSLR